jgi:hypothetical protein
VGCKRGWLGAHAFGGHASHERGALRDTVDDDRLPDDD